MGETQIFQTHNSAVLLSGGDSVGTVAVTVVIGNVLSARVSAVQHYRLCWPDDDDS